MFLKNNFELINYGLILKKLNHDNDNKYIK